MEQELIEDQLLVATFKLEPSLWTGPKEDFEKALDLELSLGTRDLRAYAIDAYDKRNNA